MKSKINLKLQFANAALVVALTAVGAAAAQTSPKEGNYDYTSCFSGTFNGMQFSKSHGVEASEYIGSNRSNPPGGGVRHDHIPLFGLLHDDRQ